MTRTGRYLVLAAGAALVAFVAGFVVFAAAIGGYTPAQPVNGDGIVVLTGGGHRLQEAARLLAEGRGKRLLISGANRMATREDLHRKSGLPAALFRCCVDIGYGALDTIGNADETRAWATGRGFARLVIVTSSYHMPRSMIELGRVLPDVALVPYPVMSAKFRTDRWWMDGATARLLFSEYVKFLPSAARFGVAMLIRSWDGSATAGAARLGALSL